MINFIKKAFIFCFLLCFIFIMPTIAEAKNTINVAFTVDKNYHLFTMLTINSILKNNTSNSDYMFYIVESDFSERQKLQMQKYVEDRGHEVTFININTDVLDKGINFFDSRQWLGRLTSISIARILLPDLLPKDVKRVLYLDADILVLKDLLPLYNTRLNGKVAGMIPDGMTPEYSFHKFKSPYFNSGVILMDLDLWRKQALSKQMLSYLHNNIDKFTPKKDSYTYFNFPDQDLINLFLKGKVKLLDDKYNHKDTSNHATLHVVIIHFIGECKPWVSFDRAYYPYYYLYYKYWDESGLKAYKYYHKYYKRWGYLSKEAWANTKFKTRRYFLNMKLQIMSLFE